MANFRDIIKRLGSGGRDKLDELLEQIAQQQRILVDIGARSRALAEKRPDLILEGDRAGVRQLDGELADLDIDKATARARLERLEAAKIEEERIRRNAAIAARIDQLDAHFARLKSAVEEAARINAEGPQIFMAAAGEFGHQAAEAFLPRVNFRGFLFEDLVAIWSKDTEKAIAGSRNALAKAATAASSAGPWSEGPRARADAVNHPVPAIAPAPAPRPKKAPPPASEPPKPPRPLLRIEGPVPEGRVPLRFTKAGIPLDDKGTLTRIGDQVAVLAFKADQLMKNGAAEPVEIKP